MRRNFTEAQIQDILNAYRDKSVTREQICEGFGISPTTLNHILHKHNEPFRVPKRLKNSEKTAAKTCPNCRRRIDVKGAKFCPFCGSDVRSARDLLIERVEKLTTFNSYIPSTERDNFIQTIIDAVKELRK